jgi:hypothetical protein
MDLEKSKISRPKKAFIPKNDCLDKELKDKTPLGPQLPQKKPIMNDYEKRNHVEKIKRKPIKYISQPDNSFNFNPPQKEKTKKRMVTEQIPSNYYQKMQNSKNAYNHWLNEKKITKKYEDKARKDNLNEIFRTNTEGNIYKERLHRKVNYKDTEVNQIFEKGKNNLPVGYKELTPNPGKVDFNQLSISAKNNYENLRKYGKKPLKKDF